jgi:hypothetical protein
LVTEDYRRQRLGQVIAVVGVAGAVVTGTQQAGAGQVRGGRLPAGGGSDLAVERVVGVGRGTVVGQVAGGIIDPTIDWLAASFPELFYTVFTFLSSHNHIKPVIFWILYTSR